MAWDDAHVKLLGVLAKARLSASSIAFALNEKFGTSYSRNAVIGQMSRNSVPLKGVPYKPTPAVAPAIPPMPDGANTPIAQRRTLLQLDNNVCKWPFGEPQSPDFFFCGGAAADGRPYCAGHCRVAYRA